LKEVSDFEVRIAHHKERIQTKEQYCFGDLDKLVELYLKTFNEKVREDARTLKQKLGLLVNASPQE